jgi:hypothetical protein
MSGLRTLAAVFTLAVLVPAAAAAQGHVAAPPDEIQGHIQRIAHERPMQAVAAAHAFLQLAGLGEHRIPRLDSLKTFNLDAYWMEVAHLAAHFHAVQNMSQRDTMRTGMLVHMFTSEAEARELQRRYRTAPAAERRAIEGRLTEVITRHFEIEDQMRNLELLDIQRRVTEIRAETERRQQRRAELVRWTVEGIIRDATKPY